MVLGQGDYIMQKASGFTLMELMVTIAIIAIISTIAVPNFIAWVPKFKLGSASRDILSVVQKTRLQAVKDNTVYTVLFNVGNESYTVFQDDGAGTPDAAPVDGMPDGRNNGILEPTENVMLRQTLPAGVNVLNTSMTGDRVVFGPQGLVTILDPLNPPPHTINIRSNQGDDKWRRRITIQLAGTTDIQIIQMF